MLDILDRYQITHKYLLTHSRCQVLGVGGCWRFYINKRYDQIIIYKWVQTLPYKLVLKGWFSLNSLSKTCNYHDWNNFSLSNSNALSSLWKVKYTKHFSPSKRKSCETEEVGKNKEKTLLLYWFTKSQTKNKRVSSSKRLQSNKKFPLLQPTSAPNFPTNYLLLFYLSIY